MEEGRLVAGKNSILGFITILTGYAGGVKRKQWLLTHEAVYHKDIQQELLYN